MSSTEDRSTADRPHSDESDEDEGTPTLEQAPDEESDEKPKSETDLQPKDPREGIAQQGAHNPVNPEPDRMT